MYDLGEIVTECLITGAWNKDFSREWAIIKAVDYLHKGLLTREEVKRIATTITTEFAQG